MIWPPNPFEWKQDNICSLYSSCSLTVGAITSLLGDCTGIVPSNFSCNYLHLHMGLLRSMRRRIRIPDSPKTESDAGFPTLSIPSASGGSTAAQNRRRASRTLFTAKDHSWINLLGMLSQAFHQSMQGRRSVSSTRGHRRLK